METTCLACLSWVNLPLPDDADSCSKKTFSVVKVARKNRKKPHSGLNRFCCCCSLLFSVNRCAIL